MARYVAFLRGVMPTNAKMADLKRCFEAAGFTDVRTVLASGNIAFTAGSRSARALARQAEAAMATHLGKVFPAVVRPSTALRELLETDPFARFRPPAKAKRVVSFLREPPKAKLPLPIESDGVRILAQRGLEVFTTYEPSPRGPVFMSLIQKTLGTDVTTRTWETVRKCSQA